VSSEAEPSGSRRLHDEVLGSVTPFRVRPLKYQMACPSELVLASGQRSPDPRSMRARA